MPDSRSALEARGVCVQLGPARVLNRIDLAAAPGDTVGIVGRNGSGKTTLLRALAGLVPLASGRIEIGGDDVSTLRRDEVARRVAIVLQETTVPFEISARDLAFIGRSPHRRAWTLDDAEDESIVADCLSRAGASAFADRPFNELSAGQRQRVVLARALAQEPRVLLLDEPSSHLDPAAALDILESLRREAARGVAVIAVLHDLTLAARYCRRVLVMKDGFAFAYGTPAEALAPDVLREAFGVAFQVRDEPEGPVVLPIAPAP